MISLNDVLLAMSNIPVDDPIAEIWGRGLQSGYKIIEYTGSLPITINANGDALLDYRIYGTDGGVGVATENLFDPNDPGIERGYYYGYNNGISTAYGDNSWESGWIPVTSGDYTFYLKRNHVGFYLYVNFYNSQKEFVKTIVNVINPNGFYTRTISDIGYVRFNGINWYATDWLVARGNVTSYIPCGYKLPMTVSDGNTEQAVPVYIGEARLDEGEYVSYGKQKIYRDVDGTLTPTDPPVPLPKIPTIDGTTVIDYDGEPKPSQVYVKYKGKSDGA